MMRQSRFRQEQIIGILREQEARMKVVNVCRKHGISDATFYMWKAGSLFIGGDICRTFRLAIAFSNWYPTVTPASH